MCNFFICFAKPVMPPCKLFTKDCFELRTVNDVVVLEQLESLNANKAVGLDNIPARFLKDGASSICSSVTHVVNGHMVRCYTQICPIKGDSSS